MTDLPHSAACTLLGCRHPVVLAGMGGVARSELVAAVTDAGGFGFLGMVREPPALIAREVAGLFARGYRRFGVNIIPAATEQALLERQIGTCIELGVPVVGLFWDVDAPLIGRLRQAGILVVHQVGTVEQAQAAEAAGAGIIIAQGVEAGGHVWGTTPLRELLPRVVEAVGVPVLAAGGMSNGRDLVTALGLGAQGIVAGTALMATHESFAHAYHKQCLVAASGDDTLLTTAFHINWPEGAKVRVLASAVTRGERGDPAAAERAVIGDEDGRPILLFSTNSPLRSMRGSFADMALYAGTGVGGITAVVGAGERLNDIVAEAADLLAADVAHDVPEQSSPACYLGEFSGTYMGHLEAAELVAALGELRLELAALLEDRLCEAPAGRAPFAPGAAEAARWVVVLDAALSRLGGTPTPLPAGRPAGTAAGVEAVGNLLTRIGEDWLRRELAPLAGFLRRSAPAAVQAKTSAAGGADELARKPIRMRSINAGSARVE